MDLRRNLVRFSAALLLAFLSPLDAKTTRGDALIAKAKIEEGKDTNVSLDLALELAQQALATDPSDTEYQLVVTRIRTFSAQRHIHAGNRLVADEKFQEALVEYEKAAAIDPAPSIATQAAKRVRAALKQLEQQPDLKRAELLMSPQTLADLRSDERFSAIKQPPQLKTQLTAPLPRFHVNMQPSSEVFALLAKLAGLRILFDPDYQNQSLGKNQILDFQGLTLEEALDYVSLISKSFWKPLSANTIFVANDDPSKRAAYDEQVTQVFYLTNVPNTQAVNNIANSVQKMTDVRRLLVHPDQNAIVVRSDPSRVDLVGKLIGDLDKPKAEIIIDVLIMSVSKDWIRNLGTVFGVAAGSTNATFHPRPQIGGNYPSGSAPTIPLSSLQRLAAGDFAVTLPGAALNALLENRGTKILDKAQLRTVEGQQSSLKIGQKVPYATGSFSPGGVSGGNVLVNTQFSYFDVGLNIDVTARVHEPDEVSLHIESDHSSVADQVNLGGVVQPVIAQRKRVAEVRVKEGEVNFWDIVSSKQSIRTTTGVPGLVNIPLLGRFFTNERREETEDQLLHLLIPHIVRSSDIRPANLAAVASGNDQVVRVRYSPLSDAAGSVQRSGPTTEVVEVEQTLPVEAPAAAANPVPSANSPTLAFQPASVTAASGAAATLGVDVNNLADAKSIVFTLKFDPSLVAWESFKAGELFTRDGKTPEVIVDIAGGEGTVLIERPPGAAPLAGAGPVLLLSFRSLAARNGEVTVSGIVRNSKDQQIATIPAVLKIIPKGGLK